MFSPPQDTLPTSSKHRQEFWEHTEDSPVDINGKTTKININKLHVKAMLIIFVMKSPA